MSKFTKDEYLSKINVKSAILFRQYRFIAYRNLTSWCWGWLGRRVRVVLPSCAVNKIRSTYPSEEYVGFKYPDIRDQLGITFSCKYYYNIYCHSNCAVKSTCVCNDGFFFNWMFEQATQWIWCYNRTCRGGWVRTKLHSNFCQLQHVICMEVYVIKLLIHYHKHLLKVDFCFTLRTMQPPFLYLGKSISNRSVPCLSVACPLSEFSL